MDYLPSVRMQIRILRALHRHHLNIECRIKADGYVVGHDPWGLAGNA